MRGWTQFLVLLAAFVIGGSIVVAQSGSETKKPATTTSTEPQPPESQSANEQVAKKDDSKPASDEPDPEAKIKKALGSPRATITTFLNAMDEGQLESAVRCLDFSKLTATADALKTKEQELAHKLKEVLDKLVQIEETQYPTSGEVDETFSLLDTQNGSIDTVDQKMADKIIIAQSDDGLWRFSSETVSNIEQMYEDLLDRDKVEGLTEPEVKAEKPNALFSIWLAERFPVEMRKTRFLLPTYQWICLAGIVLLGLLADRVTQAALNFLLRVWFRVKHRAKPPKVAGMWQPVGLFMQGLTWYLATKYIGLPTTLLTVLLVGLKYFAVIAGIWTSFHIIDLAARIARRRAGQTASRYDDLLVPLLSKSLKFCAVCVGIVICVNAFGWEVAGLLGGLGIGGMALAFASQDAISNVFGSVTVLLDRPFEVGDWIVADGVEGTVETVGFRSTRVRTFYNSVITIPNSRFTTSNVDNMGRREFRRFKTTLGVQYDTTPEQLDAFCEGIRELLRRHPYTRKDYYHVYFNDFADSSLNILLYCFFECPDWSIELRERHRLLVDIMKLAARLKVQFAFPTRTLQMFQGVPAPEDTSSEWSDPHNVGVQEAVHIAGPVLGKDERPGDVKFPDAARC